MDSKPTLDDYDEQTPLFYDEVTEYEDINGEPKTRLVKAYQDEITRAWWNFNKYANKDE